MNALAQPPFTDPAPEPSEPSRPQRLRWLRATAWIAGGFFALLAIFLGVASVVIRSARFHDYALKTAQARATESLGVPVELQNFTLSLSTLSVDLYGLTIHGAPPYANPPLLQVQHAAAGVRIVSVLHGKWYLNNFEIDRPVVRVFVDANGNTNLPTPKSSGGSSNTSIFDLAVRHAAITNGDVYYNDKKSLLAADLHDVEFRAGFDPTPQKYSGSLSYADGHLTAGTLQTFPHTFSADFDATPSTFHLSNAKLSTGGTFITLNATIENYRDPYVQAQYEAVVDGGDLRHILNNASVPTGLIRTSGTVQYHAVANRPLLDAVLASGTLSSQQLDLQTPTMRGSISDIAADYSLANGDANIRSMRARLLGGELNASAKMMAISGDSHTAVNVTLRNVSLASAQGSVRSASLPKNVAVTGGLNAQLTAAWGKTTDDLVAHADARVDGKLAGTPAGRGAPTILPLNSVIHGIYTATNRQLALNQSYLHTPQTSLTLDGVMSENSQVVLKLQSNDLHELETVADLFRTPAPGQPLQPLGLAGTATFNGQLGGSTAAPHLKGQLQAANLHVHGTEWRSIRTGVDVSPSMAKIENAQLQLATQGQISLTASAGLDKWAFTETSPVQVNLDASQLNIEDLTRAAGTQVPVSGIVAVNVKMQGTELHPVGQGNISLAHLTAYDEPIRSAQLTFSGTGDEVHGKLAVSLLAGDLQSNISIRPQQKTYTANVTADNVRIEKLQSVKARNLDATGGVTLRASGQGSFDNPQLTASLQIPQLTAQKQTVTGLNLQMNFADHVATANLVSQALNTSIRGTAKVNLTGDYLADATIDSQAIALKPLLALYAPQVGDVSGQTEVHATLHGPLKKKDQLEAHLRIPMLQVAYGDNIQLAAAAPILVDYRDSVISVQRGTIHGTDTDLQFQGSIPMTSGKPMSLLLLGTVDLQIAQLFNADLKSSGQLKFNINSYGATRDPNVEGQVQIVNANLISGDLPVGLQNGNGVLTLTRDRLNVTSFTGTVGGGTVTAQGGVAYSPSVQFDLGLSAKNIRMLYPQGMREGVDADIRLAGSTDNAVLGGSISLTELSFTPAFDLNSFISQLSGGVDTPPSLGLGQNIQLNLAVRSSNNINLVSRTLSINGTANLQVRGTAAQPVILGRVNVNSGDLIFNGDRFVLNGGTIQFVNPSQTEPVVNLALNTTIQQYSIFMRFNGPVAQLHTEYASDPSLPAADIINLLAFGKTTEANSADPSTPANQAAESLVASQVSNQVTSRVSKIAGISQLSINPVLAGGSSQGPPGANITIQQRVSGNLFITFSTNVASTQNQTIMGQYRISPRVAVSATRDQNGGFAVDTTIKKTW